MLDLRFKCNPFEEEDVQPLRNVDIAIGKDVDETKSVSSLLLSQLETEFEYVPSLEPLDVGIELPQLQLDLEAVPDDEEEDTLKSM